MTNLNTVEADELRRIYLVQRLKAREEPDRSRKGVGIYFEFDYMGASEFEWGAIPKALKRQADSKDRVEIRQIKIQSDTGEKYSIWFLGLSEQLPVVAEFFRMELFSITGPGLKKTYCLHESTYISYAYQVNKNDMLNMNSIGDRIDGWFEIESEFPWCLFRKKEDAKKWLKSL